MLELWGMQSTPSLPSLPGPLWPRVEAPDRVLSMGQIELNCVLMLNWIELEWNIWYRITLCKKKNSWETTQRMQIYMYDERNLQTSMNKITPNLICVLWHLAAWVECSPMVRETGVQSQVESYQRLKNWVLDDALLNTQHYKVWIKGKVEQSREWSCAFPYISV